MSIATVVTRGFGSFGSVNTIPTLGYLSTDQIEIGEGWCNAAVAMIDGSRLGISYTDGVTIGTTYCDGSQVGLSYVDGCAAGTAFVNG